MPRHDTIGDIEALLAAHDNYSGGVPLSVVARRAQVVVNRMKSIAGALAAVQAFRAHQLTVTMPADWAARRTEVAVWVARELPDLQNLINSTGHVDLFPPALLPDKLHAAALRWADGNGGDRPRVLSALVRHAAEKIIRRARPAASPMVKPRFLRTDDGGLLSFGNSLLNVA